jgi:hypothetical protein
MQIPILSGVYADTAPGLRESYPVNLLPTPMASGISDAYLMPGDGIVQLGDAVAPGVDRGGINWQGICYRVMGSKLVTVSATGAIAILGDVGSDGNPATLDYSFELLGIASAGSLFFWNPATSTLTQNTDPDLGTVLDVVWVDGYWMTTDGEFLVVTELGDPFAVNPLKYGSSEADPDPVVALLKIRNEVYALNRHTVEVFDNVGGSLFPFQRIDGAQIEKGCVGTHACCVYMEALAFLGSGVNEAPGIYIGANATAQKISTQEVDQLLMAYDEATLSQAIIEARNDRNHQLLYVHLLDRTLIFDGSASEAMKRPIWSVATSALVGFSQYRAQNLVWCYGRWIVGDPLAARVGYLDSTVSSHWGTHVRWEFGTVILYNESRGAIMHELELVALTGSIDVGLSPQISTSYTLDGITWSQDRYISAGMIGNREKRLTWYRQGFLRKWRAQRFRGDSSARISPVRLEARIEQLAV